MTMTRSYICVICGICVRFKLFHHDLLSVLDVQSASGLLNATALQVEEFLIAHCSFLI